MKRYRLFAMSFDTRSEILKTEIKDEWKNKIREQWIENKQQVIEGVKQEYGTIGIDRKLADFTDLGREPFSVITFHNEFLRQCRYAFIAGSYYPALTGACALGERILNHMVLKLRNYYKGSPSYKRVYDKKSFDNWDLAIGVLEEWQVFVTVDDLTRAAIKVDNYGSEVADLFRELCAVRNDSIHFRIDLDVETREPALRAIQLLQEIVTKQFGVGGWLPWYIREAPGAFYIKREFESHPFIREFYLPSCVCVGPSHHAILLRDGTWQVNDPGPYPDKEISDKEFARLANVAKA